MPVRDVTAPLAKATRPIGGANMLRALPDGSIFINDVQRRQLLRFDATLQNVMVVADTAPGALMPYGQRPIGLIPYLGDSSIVVDPAARGRGIAQQLIEAAHRQARQRGCRRVVLEVRCDNAAALALYRRLGYQPIEMLPTYYEDGADGTRLAVDLT